MFAAFCTPPPYRRCLADWTHLRIPIGPGDLTGGSDVDAVLSHVTKIGIMHNLMATSSTLSPPIAAQIGIDNVTAAPVPEPSMALLTGAGLAALHALLARTGASPAIVAGPEMA